MLQISAVTRLRSVAITEDARSQDSFIRKPSRAVQLEAPPTKQTLTGRLHYPHLISWPPALLRHGDSGQQCSAAGAAQREAECYRPLWWCSCRACMTVSWPSLNNMRLKTCCCCPCTRCPYTTRSNRALTAYTPDLCRPQPAPHRPQPEDAGSFLLTAAI